jgi:hypothetical protein
MADSGTVFDGTLRDERPEGSSADVQSGHTSQWYADGYRVSWDDLGQEKLHWTDQTRPKGDSERHESPGDVKK